MLSVSFHTCSQILIESFGDTQLLLIQLQDYGQWPQERPSECTKAITKRPSAVLFMMVVPNHLLHDLHVAVYIWSFFFEWFVHQCFTWVPFCHRMQLSLNHRHALKVKKNFNLNWFWAKSGPPIFWMTFVSNISNCKQLLVFARLYDEMNAVMATVAGRIEYASDPVKWSALVCLQLLLMFL